ncbi:MAG: methionyl-tRNA formyltransferase [Gammaproteobacteria bacterium]|nr:methionyl-tRNA formyltransferase [Gammaproteobacteria bacterium]
MNLSFAGTPELAAVILGALIETPQHRIRHVYTQPDRPAGRGRKNRPSPVKQLAQRFAIPVKQPASAAELARDADLAGIDALIVVAYGLILPAQVLSRPSYGCINVHASLLPRWRGAAPIQRAIQAGDSETGISIMVMDRGIDTGRILLRKACAIGKADTALSLSERLALLGAECLPEALAGLADGSIDPVNQDDEKAIYAHKVTKQEAEIDWNAGAEQIERSIRAFNPAPVAHTCLNDVKIRVWEARTLDAVADRCNPGNVISYGPEGLDVCTGSGVLRILALQLEGKKKQAIREIHNGYPGLFVPRQ